jgi:hypothetical protein
MEKTDISSRTKDTYLVYSSRFEKTFGLSLQYFWDPLTGMDETKFTTWLKAQVWEYYGETTRELVTRLYGLRAWILVYSILNKRS